MKNENNNRLYLTPEVYFDYNYGEVSLYYTEHSADPWYGDRESEVDITKEDAKRIIEYLNKHYFEEDNE